MCKCIVRPFVFITALIFFFSIATFFSSPVSATIEPTPFVRVHIVNPQLTPVQMAEVCRADCKSNACVKTLCTPNRSNFSFGVKQNTQGYSTKGARISIKNSNNQNMAFVGVTPQPGGGTFINGCRDSFAGRCYVWPNWNTGKREVTFVVSRGGVEPPGPSLTPTPTKTPTPSLTGAPSPTPDCDNAAGTCPQATPLPTEEPTNTPTPSPTLVPNPAALKFKVKLPDITNNISPINSVNVFIQVFAGASEVFSGVPSLTKVGDYYVTEEMPINISESKQYAVSIKVRPTLRRTFNNVSLMPSATLDCTVDVNDACGELITKRDVNLLLSGDSDGFVQSSESYNKIDSADLQALVTYFNQTASTDASRAVDFNMDGKIDINDLEILGRNYGLQGN